MGEVMKRKIIYTNFEPKDAENNYLRFRLNELEEDYPEVVNCKVAISKDENSIYQIRVTGKYLKVDFTTKRKGSILLLCINKIMTQCEEKLNMVRRRYRLSSPARVNRSAVFLNDNFIHSYERSLT